MRVANGPASTHVKSTTRSPASGLPAPPGPAWRSPSGVAGGTSTSRQSGEDVGDVGRRRRRRLRAAGTGWRRIGRTGPGIRALGKPSTARNVPRWAYWGLAATWATVCTSPKATWRRWASWNSSPESFVAANRRMAFITRGIWANDSSGAIAASAAPSASPSSAIHSNSGAPCGVGATLQAPVLALATT